MEEQCGEVLYTFSKALELAKNGQKVARKGWNGAKFGGLKMFITSQYPDLNSANTNPYLYMVVGEDRTPWFPSNLDFFNDDWELVD